MRRMLLDGMILKSAVRINQERTVTNIYYLLTGKRSIQTVQDAHMYGIDDFFGVYKTLSKQNFEKKIQVLIQNGLLQEKYDSDNRRFLSSTNKTGNWLKEHEEQLPFHYFRGMSLHEKGEVFYHRLLLLIQTFTNTNQKNFSFIPVVDNSNAERWVKQFYRTMRGKENEYLKQLEQELNYLLYELPTEEASIFVDRLSGYKHYGMSIGQLANLYQKENSDIYLLLIGIIHYILNALKQNESIYPALNNLITDYRDSVKLLGSTVQTYHLFKQGRIPEEIASIRRLKINTIYDHLTEISLYDPYFPFTQFISIEEQQEVLEAIDRTNSYKLKEIKNTVQSDINYFQIRLMLVLHHKLKEEGALNTNA